MATKALTNDAIAMTEKKINMTLDDIIQMSKKNAAKGKRPPRPPIKNQGFQKKNPSQANAMLQGFMDSRSSIRQGVLAKRRSNFHGNQFPVITELARKAAAISFENRVINQNGRRVVTPTLQRSANAGSTSKRPQTLDALFANMNEMRMNFVSQKINPGGRVQLAHSPFGSRQQQRRGGPSGGVQLAQRPFGSKQQQGRGGRGPRGGVQLAQMPFGSKQQQGRGGRGPRGGVRLGQRRFGSGQQQGRGGPHGGAHGLAK